MAQEKILDIVKSSKTIQTPYTLDAARIKSNSQIEIYDSTGVYGHRLVTANGITYMQGGKVDRDITDQRMMLSGWYGTPLSDFRINMAAGTQPKVRIEGASTYDILHRGNMPTAEEIKAMAVYDRPDGDDCNNAIMPGNYSVFSNTKNTPFGSGPSGSTLLVTRWGNNASSQIFIPYTTDRVFVRRMYIGVWQPWFELYSTSNKPTPADIGTLTTAQINTELGKKLNLSGGNVTGNISSTATYRTSINQSLGFVMQRTGTTYQAGIGQGTDGMAVIGTGTETNLEAWLKVGPSTLIFTGNKVYHSGDKPTAVDVGALPLTGGIMTGALTVANMKSAIKVDSQRSISFQDGGNARFHILAEGNTFKLKHGNNAENQLLQVSPTLLELQTQLSVRTAMFVSGEDGTRLIGLGAQESSGINPYIYVRRSGDTANIRVMTFNDGEIIANQDRIAAPSFRVINNAGLIFTPFENKQGLSWGMGMDLSNGNLGIHRYQDGVWNLQPFMIGSNGVVTMSTGFNTTSGTMSGSLSVNGNIEVGGSVGVNSGYASIISNNNNRLEFHRPGFWATMIYMNTDGQLRFTSSNGAGGETALRASLNNAGVFTCASLVQTSDRRLKTDIEELSNCLEKNSKLVPSTYHKEGFDEDVREAGLMAQDVQAVLPEAVIEGDEGILGVNYAGVTTLNTGAINELHNLIKEQQKEIEELKSKL
ncbi:TPA: tail fiber domain-containing protein [Aeromonas hydrophila]